MDLLTKLRDRFKFSVYTKLETVSIYALSVLSNVVYVLAQLGAGSVSAQLSYQPELPKCLQEK